MKFPSLSGSSQRLPCREDTSLIPVCPHCSKELTHVSFRELETDFGRRYIYCCPSCSKVLGVSHRKGFWMG